MTLQTIIRTDSSSDPERDFLFADRLELTEAMSDACFQASRSILEYGEAVYDFGFEEPVLVTINDHSHRDIKRALGLIAYKDADVEALFFLFEAQSGLVSVMGDCESISSAFGCYLDMERYHKLAWDASTLERSHRFEVEDFTTLWCNQEQVEIAGAQIDGLFVSIQKQAHHQKLARLPVLPSAMLARERFNLEAILE